MVKLLKCGIRLSVRSSSLIEVTTALVIISMVFGLALSIYLQIQKSGVSMQQVQAGYMLASAMADAEASGVYETIQVEADGYRLFQEVVPDERVSNLFHVSWEVQNGQGKLIASRKRLIYVVPE